MHFQPFAKLHYWQHILFKQQIGPRAGAGHSYTCLTQHQSTAPTANQTIYTLKCSSPAYCFFRSVTRDSAAAMWRVKKASSWAVHHIRFPCKSQYLLWTVQPEIKWKRGWKGNKYMAPCWLSHSKFILNKSQIQLCSLVTVWITACTVCGGDCRKATEVREALTSAFIISALYSSIN